MQSVGFRIRNSISKRRGGNFYTLLCCENVRVTFLLIFPCFFFGMLQYFRFICSHVWCLDAFVFSAFGFMISESIFHFSILNVTSHSMSYECCYLCSHIYQCLYKLKYDKKKKNECIIFFWPIMKNWASLDNKVIWFMHTANYKKFCIYIEMKLAKTLKINTHCFFTVVKTSLHGG